MQHTAEKAATDKAACCDSALNILFLALFPVVLWLFRGSPEMVALALIQMLLLGVAVRLISTGHAIARAHDAARMARRPRFPRKIAGSALIGLVVMILGAHQFSTPAMPLLLGMAGAGLSIAAFGIDPMRDKGLDDPEMMARMEAEAVLAGLEETLSLATHRIAGLGDPDLTRRTQGAQDMVLRLVRSVAGDPAEMKRLRIPATKFADILLTEIDRLEASWEGEQYTFARRRYTAKLEVLSETFEQRLHKRGSGTGRDAYDVEADILLDRMRHGTAA